MAGRKEDSVWQFYLKTTDSKKSGCRATCKNCKKEIQGIVQRLKAHREICKKQQETRADIQVPLDWLDPVSSGSSASILTLPSPSTSSIPDCSTTTTESTVLVQMKKKNRENQPAMSMSSFILRTTAAEKHKIDKQIAKAIFATNSSFRCIENSQVKKAIHLLRPG